MNLDKVYLVTSRLSRSTATEVAQVEKQLNINFPPDYTEFVTQLGEGTYAGFVRVYPPNKILSEYRAFQERWDEYFFWDEGDKVLPKAKVLECIIVGDTLQGDELIIHPLEPNRLLVLPRESEEIFEVGTNLESALAWLCESGVLTERITTTYFESWTPRERQTFMASTEFDPVLKTLTGLELHDHLQVNHEDEFGELFVAEFGGSIVAGFDGVGMIASITYDKDAPSTKLDVLLQSIRALGFTPEDPG